jgi:hypothetical protein
MESPRTVGVFTRLIRPDRFVGVAAIWFVGARAKGRGREGRRLPASSVSDESDYCAGAAGSTGFIVLSVPGAGAGAGSTAGGLVLCVVVVSVPVPLSLQAAMPNKATADKEARMTFFMTVSSRKTRQIGAAARRSGWVTAA